MNRFAYHRAENVADAVRVLASDPQARALAGGTNLVDLMKYDVMKPTMVVDLARLPLGTIDETEDGGLRLGALVSNADTAEEARVKARYPLLAHALLAGASGQLRNAATTGGNLSAAHALLLLLRPRHALQQKRDPAVGVPVPSAASTRIHAILGASAQLHRGDHPSDMKRGAGRARARRCNVQRA